MTHTPWPCDTCGAPGVRNLGAHGHCAVHLAELYDRFDPAVFKMSGVGIQHGALAPEFGPTYAHLRCNACGATWAGVPGEVCRWCADALKRMHEWQAELLLTEPDTDPTDARYIDALRAWADRLDVGVAAGIIDRKTAERALLRGKTRAA